MMNVSKFYSSSKSQKALKRRLEQAHTSIKINRTQDILLCLKDNLLQESVPLIFRVFQKQSEALDFATSFHYSTFAIEHDCQGKRHFMTCHPQTFWKWLKAKAIDDRHAYEVIGEDLPSKVYFDLEYKYQEENDFDGQNLLARFKKALAEDLKVSFNNIKDCEVIDLDSSTSEKFSHHLIVNMTNEESEPVFFVDNRQVGFYVKKFLEKVQNLLTLPSGKTFVDEAVYSKNRNFRTLLSSKYGKKVALKNSDCKMANPPTEDFFFKSLVTFSSKMESKKLVRFDPTTMSYKRIEVAGSKHNINARGEAGNKREKPTSKVASAFPEVDRFIKDLVHKNNGYIRKISFQDCWFLVYELANYRFCHNIKRPHKSNNVKFVVDLRSNQYCQMCHDPQCKDFRSDFWALPSHCAIPWQELFESEEAKSPTQWDSSLNEADEKELEALLVEAADETQDEKELEALLVEAADKTQDENDMEALLLEAATEDETENQEENNDEAIEALLLEAEKEAAEDEFLLNVYSQNLPF